MQKTRQKKKNFDTKITAHVLIVSAYILPNTFINDAMFVFYASLKLCITFVLPSV